MWGQGLLDGNKFAGKVAGKLGLTLNLTLAHSGAVIGRTATCGPQTWPGEVPQSCRSILQQVADYKNDPTTVPVVILNGGINDVDIRTILNPFTDPGDLARDIQQYCYTDMGFLLEQAKAKFPNARIVVASYYPILSSKSDFTLVPVMTEFLGAPLPRFITDVENVFGPGDPLADKILALSIQFWNQSTQALQQCVKAVNLGTGPRCLFANVPFTEDNSVFAPNAWLFGVGPAPNFAAQDEVIGVRTPQCNVAFPTDIFAREQCYRASAGHPNDKGAAQFAQAILGVLG
jgi:hypothetical protein